VGHGMRLFGSDDPSLVAVVDARLRSLRVSEISMDLIAGDVDDLLDAARRLCAVIKRGRPLVVARADAHRIRGTDGSAIFRDKLLRVRSGGGAGRWRLLGRGCQEIPVPARLRRYGRARGFRGTVVAGHAGD